MATTDEQLLAAFQSSQSGDPDAEPVRHDDGDDGYSAGLESMRGGTDGGHDPFAGDPNATDDRVSRILEDQQIRQQLGLGGPGSQRSDGPMTGPKGVLADHRFHQRQEKARQDEERAFLAAKMGKAAMSKGWLRREIEREEKTGVVDSKSFAERQREEEDEADELIRALEEEEADIGDRDPGGATTADRYRQQRLLELAQLSLRPRFGKCTEIEVDDYVKAIDDEDPAVTVVIHLYQPQIEACRQVNTFLAGLAPVHPTVKFLRILSTKADRDFDVAALPALLVYKAGDLKASLLRMTDEIDGWARTGRCSAEDFEDYLRKSKVLDD
ncbi:Phosducin-domain-containing protein [Zopfochytrium polystomum]|nr:Phosducin-domain-containing protein [Zopfochytrium polystomum]